MLLPMVVLVVVAWQDRQSTINATQNEQEGLGLVVAGNQLLREVQVHRDLSNIVRSGDLTQREALARARADVDTSLNALNAAYDRNGKKFNLQELHNDINIRWAAILEMGPGEPAARVWDAHTALVNEGIFRWIFAAGNNSGLTTDPDRDAQNAISAVKDTLPLLTEQLSQARGIGAGAIANSSGSPASDSVKAATNDNMARAGLLSQTFTRNLQESMKENPVFKEALTTLLLESTINRNVFVNAVNNNILNGPTLNGLPAAYFISGATSIDSTNEVLTATQDVLGQQFTSRKSAAKVEMYRSGGLVFMTIGCAFLLVLVIAASITRPIAHLVEVADRISLGELDAEIDVAGTNEVGQLAESLRRMQTSLRSAIERLRTRRAAA
jgi:HAMP domain-containing protein